jgi:hypothetical protein
LGSTVNYEAYINGVSLDTGSFTWSGKYQNYVGLFSSNRGTPTMDHFATTVVPEPTTALLGIFDLLRRRESHDGHARCRA